ncbi:transposase [Orrella marina]|uniref:transposase n=1 Tax=Orrella marina TaxID=2163011 RepID=UPI001D131DD2|nr:transposase [Orrella marina]
MRTTNALDISVLINNIKTASTRRARNRRARNPYAEHIAAFYKKPQFWHRACFVGSVGGVTFETVRACVDARGTEEHARKAVTNAKANGPGPPRTRPPACPPPVRSASPKGSHANQTDQQGEYAGKCSNSLTEPTA